MFQRIRLRVVLIALCSVFATTPTWAEDAPEAAKANDEADRHATIEAAIKENTAEVVSILKESAAFLAAQPKFSYQAYTGYDAVQANGQKLEFGATRKVTVRRPDRLRVDVKENGGERRALYFDSQKLSIDLPDAEAYVVVEKPGTLDAAIDYLVDDLDTPAPLHELIKSNYFADAADHVRSGFYVEKATIMERSCHHLALRFEAVDLQVWIEDGDRPLPCALVITYKREEASPQYWAQFSAWDLSPKTPDSLFSYTAPKNAERLSIQAAVAAAREEKGVE